MRYLLICSVLIIRSAYAGLSFAGGESIDVSSEKERMEILLEQRQNCIDKIENGKVYFKPEAVYPVKERIFLWVNHFDLVELPNIQCDENGHCFIWLVQ